MTIRFGYQFQPRLALIVTPPACCVYYWHSKINCLVLLQSAAFTVFNAQQSDAISYTAHVYSATA